MGTRGVGASGAAVLAGLVVACGGGGGGPAGSGPNIQIGQSYRLQSSAKALPVCRDTETLLEVSRAIEEGNEAVLQGYARQGKLLIVTVGTLVRVTHLVPGSAEVIILEGEFASQKGYVFQPWLVAPAVEQPAEKPAERAEPVPEPEAPSRASTPPPEHKSELPTKTITPAGGVPVPVALTPADLSAYKAADTGKRKTFTAKMVKDGVIQLITAATEVGYEQTVGGLAYVRMPDGPLKGRLVVMDAEYLK